MSSRPTSSKYYTQNGKKYFNRGSGKLGEVNGIDFDQYERRSDDLFCSNKKKRQLQEEENEYEKQKLCERKRFKSYGYVLDGFIVNDEYVEVNTNNQDYSDEETAEETEYSTAEETEYSTAEETEYSTNDK